MDAMFPLLLFACSRPPPAPAVSEEPSWVGRWRGPPCGERAYVRWLTLREDGTAEVEDHVAPCPPGAPCVWSGIHLMTGRWEARGTALRLQVGPPPSGPPVVDLPRELVWDGGIRQGPCRYEQVP